MVAVTGIGVVSPFGHGFGALSSGLLEGRSCLKPLTIFDAQLDSPPTVAEIKELPDVNERGGFYLSRTDRLAVLAAMEAAEASGSSRDFLESGAIVATTVAGLSDIDPSITSNPAQYYREGGLARAASYPASHPAEAVGAWLGLRGPCWGVSVACASGAIAIALAASMIVAGDAPMMLAGGSDALATYTLSGFSSLQALDAGPCRPFDKKRKGLNLGEGAAVFVLESVEHARARNANILAILRGWGMSNDAFHQTAPDEQGRGLASCMTSAMAMAGVKPDEIGYVNSHGTGTELNDVAEVQAYETAFGARKAPIPVSSTKSYIGHCLGAAGALEAAIAIAGMRSSTLFPTLRLTDPIDSSAIDWLTGQPRRQPLPVAMTVSAGFGGSNAGLIFELPGNERSGGIDRV
ncbi:MAG TPA: beta-ketoacyl-[acyl-carrier-protein] synthase family protein [Candidatus Sulfotelmatobacter sp.]|nr:beta-ketoacyl-[acyl-carrier-protein] synthase family protein [Candidatus Sulfotelmatobacter sp.]